MSLHFWRKVYLFSFQKILILLFKKIPSSLFQECFLVFSKRVSQTFFIIFHEPLPKEFLNLFKKVSLTCFKKFPKIFSENLLNFSWTFSFFQRKSHEQKSFLNLTLLIILKGQCHEIVWHFFISLFEAIWAPW